MAEKRKFLVDQQHASRGFGVIGAQPVISPAPAPSPPTVTPSPSVPTPTPTPSPTPGTPAPTPTPTPPTPTPTPVPVPPTPTPTPDPTLRYDDFLRIDGPLGTTPTGNVWVISSGTWAILSHQARLVTSSGTGTNICIFEATANSDTQVTIPVIDDGVGLVFRYIDANNYLKFTSSTSFNTYALFQVVGGTQTWLGDVGPIGIANGDLLRVSAIDSTVSCSVNGSHTFSVTNSAGITGKSVGLFSANSTTARFSIIQAFARSSTAPTPTPTPIPPTPTPTPTNLVPASFAENEDASPAWIVTSGGANLTNSPLKFHVGSKSLLATGTVAANLTLEVPYASRFPLSPNTTYNTEVWLQGSESNWGIFVAQFFDAAGAFISPAAVIDQKNVSNTTFTQLAGQIVTPVNCATCTLKVEFLTALIGGTYNVDTAYIPTVAPAPTPTPTPPSPTPTPPSPTPTPPSPTPTPPSPTPTPTPTPVPGNARYPSHASTDTGAIVGNITSTLSPGGGTQVVSGSNPTFTNTKIQGAIDARTATGTLTLNNVWVEFGYGASFCVWGGPNLILNATNLTISVKAGVNVATLGSENCHGIMGFNGATVNNYNISGCVTGIDPGNGTWTFTYGDIHHLGKYPGSRPEGAHTECLFVGLSGNGRYTFNRTRFDHRNESGSWSTGGIFTEEWHGACQGLILDNCLLESMGAYSLYGTRSNGAGGTESPTAANCPISVTNCDFQYMATGTPRPWGSYYRFWFNSVPVWTNNWEVDGNDARTRVLNLPTQATNGGSDVNSQQVIDERLWTPGTIVPTPTPTPPSPTPTPPSPTPTPTPTPTGSWWAADTRIGQVLNPPTGPKQSLTTTVGSASLTGGQTLSRTRVTGIVTVTGAGNTISDCWVGEVNNQGGSGTLIQDTKIDNGASNAGVYYNNYTLIRCEVTRCFDGLKGLGTTTIDNCWIHDLNNQNFADGTYTHNDGLQMSSGSNLRITNSRFENTGINSGIFIDPDQGVISGVVIDSCYIQGGIWGLFVVNSASNPGTGNPLNMQFSNIIFGAPPTNAASYAGYCNVANQTGVPISCTWINNKTEKGVAIGQVSKDTPQADRWRTRRGINV